MRRLWIWLWLAVLVGQLSSLWVVKQFAPAVDPVLNAVEPGLLELLRDTAEAWEGFETGDSGQPDLSNGNSLLAREEWLLRIRDAERAAQARGIEVRVTGELLAWMQSATSDPSESVEQGRLIAYLMDLDQWLETFAAQNGRVSMERLLLQPDSHSPYPALQFELQGPPDQMATLLHDHTQSNLDWEVRELDLNRQPGEAGWWLQGSCAFRNRVPE